MSGALKSKDGVDVVDFISQLISKISGVELGVKQKSMVEARLKKRMMDIGIDSYEKYLSYFHKNEKLETNELVSLLTTHYTYFFREFNHFEFLNKSALALLIEVARKRGDKKIRVWSAACSRGQEVYSLAMFFSYHLGQIAPDIDFEIIGTDIDEQSIKVAQKGVYHYQDLNEIPSNYLSNHWAREGGSDYVKAKSSLTSRCEFEVLNLINVENFRKTTKFDIIFCRNVFIYFSEDQIKNVSQYFLTRLLSTGYLFIGASESLNGLNLQVEIKGPSIYTHKKENSVFYKKVA